MYSRKYIRPVVSASTARSERPTPPPDYAGITFRTSDERTLQDFPETVIPAAEADSPPIPSRSAAMPPEAAYMRSDGENTELTADAPPYEPLDFADAPYDDEAETEDANSAPPEMPDAPADESPNESEPITAPPLSDALGDAESPLQWLRELKMEDFLLLWMLLMLLYGESNDEIDLLLGLLLFAGH